MDKLAKRLRDDADQIECTVSPELDDRIQASLRGITPAEPQASLKSKPFSLWWASSLTGAAAAIVLIVIANLNAPEVIPEVVDATRPLQMPGIQWQARTAVLTSPLEQEIEDLQSDLKKAEEAVKQDIERLF